MVHIKELREVFVMSMKSRRILAALVATILMLSVFTACGSSAASSSSTAAASAPAASAEADAASAAPAVANEVDFSDMSLGRRTAIEIDTGGSYTATSTETFDLKLAHVSALSAPYHVGAEYMAQLVENRTNGNVKITVYGASALGNETEVIEGLQMNTVDMMVTAVAPLYNFTEAFGFIDIPYLFDDFEHAYAVLDGPIGSETLSTLEPHGIIGLGFMEGYFQTLHTSKPVYTAEDMHGLKIRTMESQMHMDFINDLGGIALPMPFSEVYSALDNKTIDGVSTNMSFYTSSNFFIPAPYSTMTLHLYSASPILISKATWDRLPEDYQNIMRESAMEAARWQRWYNSWFINRDMTALEAEGKATFIWPSDEDMKPFREAGQRVQESVVPNKFSQELIDSIKNTKWTNTNHLEWYEPVWENWADWEE